MEIHILYTPLKIGKYPFTHMQYKDHETLIKSAEDHFLHGLLYWYFPVQAQVASFKVFLHRLSEFLATSNLFLSDVSLWSQWYYTSVNLVCDQCLMTRLFSAVTYELFWNSLPNFFMRIFYFQPKCPKFCDMQLFEVKLFYSWALYKNIYWIWKKKKYLFLLQISAHFTYQKVYSQKKSEV